MRTNGEQLISGFVRLCSAWKERDEWSKISFSFHRFFFCCCCCFCLTAASECCQIISHISSVRFSRVFLFYFAHCTCCCLLAWRERRVVDNRESRSLRQLNVWVAFLFIISLDGGGGERRNERCAATGSLVRRQEWDVHKYENCQARNGNGHFMKFVAHITLTLAERAREWEWFQSQRVVNELMSFNPSIHPLQLALISLHSLFGKPYNDVNEYKTAALRREEKWNEFFKMQHTRKVAPSSPSHTQWPSIQQLLILFQFQLNKIIK